MEPTPSPRGPLPESLELVSSLSEKLDLHIVIEDTDGAVLHDTHPKLETDSFDADAPISGEGGVVGTVRLACLGEPREGGALARHLAQSLARDLDARSLRRSELDRLARRERERDLMRRFSQPSADEMLEQVVPIELLEDVAGSVGEGFVLVSLMSADLTYVKGRIGKRPASHVSIEDDTCIEILNACMESEAAWTELASEVLPGFGTNLEGRAFRIQASERPIGFIALLQPAGSDDSMRPFRLLEGLAHRIADGVATIQLRAELHGFLFDTVKSLAAAVDAKDPYTRGHSERVHYLAVRVGELMGLDDQDMQDLNWAGLLHDIGKIGIPRDILCKPQDLTPEEWDTIRTHPDRGCRVVEPIPQLAGARAGIRYHHENYDGTGYPAGLSGAEIPLSARIIAAADAFDALTSDRPYMKGRSCEEALDLLDKGAGRRFDPAVLAAVRKIVEQEIRSGSLAFESLRRPSQNDVA